MDAYKEDDQLIHYGIKRMKWGVRRYQNPDGTLTEAGKKRYSRSPEGLGYTPLRGKKGDKVQQHFGKVTGKLEKKARRVERLLSKAKESDKTVKQAKLENKERKLKTTALIARNLNKKYSELSIIDRQNIKDRYKKARGKNDMSEVVRDIGGSDEYNYDRIIRDKKTYGKYGKRLFKK